MALSHAQEAEVTRQVATMLGGSASFAQLPPKDQAEIFDNTRRVVAAMAESRQAARPGDPYAVALEDPVQPGGPKKLRETREAQQRAKAGEFGAGVDKGIDQIARLIDEVGFPEFCAALISGVFQSIVDTSIQQMKAYAEMVKGVTSSLNDFKEQNVSPNQGRDHLVSKYPKLFKIDISSGGGPRVKMRDDADTDNLPDFQRELGLSQPVEDLDDDSVENVLVDAARTDLARGRQQLLATLVLMGINRIVVTDGKIKAKVKFNFSSSDTQTVTAQDFDYKNMGTIYTAQGQRDSGGESGQYTQGADGTVTRGPGSRYLTESYQRASMPDVRLTSQKDTFTESNINATADMLGEVSINFKSETFPLEKLVNTDQISQLQGIQQGGMRGTPVPAPAAAPGTATPVPAPTPAPAPAP
jgi:hypothetical protein